MFKKLIYLIRRSGELHKCLGLGQNHEREVHQQRDLKAWTFLRQLQSVDR